MLAPQQTTYIGEQHRGTPTSGNRLHIGERATYRGTGSISGYLPLVGAPGCTFHLALSSQGFHGRKWQWFHLRSNPLWWLAIIICNSESGFCSNANLYMYQIEPIHICRPNFVITGYCSPSVIVRTSRDQMYFSLDPFWLLWGVVEWNTPVAGISVVPRNVSFRKLNSGICASSFPAILCNCFL